MVRINIDEILAEMAKKIGKRKGDLKRTYNVILKKKTEEGIGGFVPEENLQRLVLIGVSTKYKLSIIDLDEILASNTVEEEEEEEEEPDLEAELEDLEETLDVNELEDDVEFEEDEDDELEEDDDSDIEFEEDDDDYGLGTREGTWEDIFANTPEPKEGEGDFERLESLSIISGTTYYLKLVDPTEVPYVYEGVDKRDENKTYTSRAMDVILLKVTPKSRYVERYEKGDNRGKKCFINKKKYKLWMTETAFKWFAKFWRDEVGRKSPDGRVWTFEQLKKENSTKYYFSEYHKK